MPAAAQPREIELPVRYHPKILLNGIDIQVTPKDLDQDGTTGGIEYIQQHIHDDIQPILQPTETAETIKALNNDDLEKGTRMSGIDLKSRLKEVEISAILAVDACVSLGFLPTKLLSLTRQKKRLSVSLDGKGRQEIVEISHGETAKRESKGFLGKIGAMFSPKQ